MHQRKWSEWTCNGKKHSIIESRHVTRNDDPGHLQDRFDQRSSSLESLVRKGEPGSIFGPFGPDQCSGNCCWDFHKTRRLRVPIRKKEAEQYILCAGNEPVGSLSSPGVDTRMLKAELTGGNYRRYGQKRSFTATKSISSLPQLEQLSCISKSALQPPWKSLRHL